MGVSPSRFPSGRVCRLSFKLKPEAHAQARERGKSGIGKRTERKDSFKTCPCAETEIKRRPAALLPGASASSGSGREICTGSNELWGGGVGGLGGWGVGGLGGWGVGGLGGWGAFAWQPQARSRKGTIIGVLCGCFGRTNRWRFLVYLVV